MQIYDGVQKIGIIIATFLHFLTIGLLTFRNCIETSQLEILYTKERVRNIEFIL